MPEAVVQIQQAAERVARHMPAAHWPIEFWRPLLFKWAAERFTRVVYNLDVAGLSDADLQEAEKLVLTGQHLIEAYMTLRASRNELQGFTNIVRQLREAVDGLQQGLAPDPAKRPSDDELMDCLARNLREARAV